MTQQEFVKKIDKPGVYIGAYADGLSKGLEIAEKFGVWLRRYDSDESRGFYHKFNDGSHGKSHITPKFYTIEQLLEIYLTEKYGQ